MDAKFVPTSVLVAYAVVTTGCGPLMQGLNGNQVKGSGVLATEKRLVKGDFTRIREDGAANVFVRVGPAASVKVEGDDNIVPLVKTTVEDDTLVIKTKKQVRQKKKLLVTVTIPSLKEVQLDGAGNITVKDLQSTDFKVGLDGAGNITVGGSTASLSASINGAGNLRLADLKSETASASVDGAGNLDLWVTGKLSASIDGVGNIRYKGNPEVTKSVNGVGRVTQS